MFSGSAELSGVPVGSALVQVFQARCCQPVTSPGAKRGCGAAPRHVASINGAPLIASNFPGGVGQLTPATVERDLDFQAVAPAAFAAFKRRRRAPAHIFAACCSPFL